MPVNSQAHNFADMLVLEQQMRTALRLYGAGDYMSLLMKLFTGLKINGLVESAHL